MFNKIRSLLDPLSGHRLLGVYLTRAWFIRISVVVVGFFFSRHWTFLVLGIVCLLFGLYSLWLELRFRRRVARQNSKVEKVLEL